MNLKFSVLTVKEDKNHNSYQTFTTLPVTATINNSLFHYMYMIITEVFKIHDIPLLYCTGRGYFSCISWAVLSNKEVLEKASSWWKVGWRGFSSTTLSSRGSSDLLASGSSSFFISGFFFSTERFAFMKIKHISNLIFIWIRYLLVYQKQNSKIRNHQTVQYIGDVSVFKIAYPESFAVVEGGCRIILLAQFWHTEMGSQYLYA